MKKKIVFYGIQYSGKRSTMDALARANSLQVDSEYWNEEATDIRRIISAELSTEIVTWLVPYNEEKARVKLFDGATAIYYFISIPNNNENALDEVKRQVSLFPIMVKKAEELGKGLKDIPWTIIFSKCDRIPNNPYLKILPEEYLKNILHVSAKTGQGVDKLWKKISSE